MIRVQIYCDVCKSSVDAVTTASKLQAAVNGFNELHGSTCFFDQEVSGGQDQAVPGGEAPGRNQPGETASAEGGATPRASVGRA